MPALLVQRSADCITHNLEAEPTMENLDESLEPLRAWFEREAGHVRIVAIQSPT